MVGEALPLRGEAGELLPLPLLRGEVHGDRRLTRDVVSSFFFIAASTGSFCEAPAAWLVEALISSRRRRISVGDRRLLPKASPAGLVLTIVLKETYCTPPKSQPGSQCNAEDDRAARLNRIGAS